MQRENNERRLRVLTWPVHGTYFYYLSHCDCDFLLPVQEGRSGYGGKGDGTKYQFGPNVIEVPVAALPQTDFDIILFQERSYFERDQFEIFTEAQRQKPKVYLEHDPPRQHPTDTKHWVTDPAMTLVHVTHFNNLMWDSNDVPTAVIDHGVVDPGYQYAGALDCGIVVVNNLHKRGRIGGYDIYRYVLDAMPLHAAGISADEYPGGQGEVPHNELGAFTAQYRFFFHPMRYTSLGLAVIEAMLVGLPIIGLPTTELVSVIQNGVNGWLSLDPNELIAQMERLLADPELARAWGRNARATALRRFNMQRFTGEWEALFASACARAQHGTAP